jgi:hypothetical protein
MSNITSIYPGPQKRKFRFELTLFTLYFLLLIFLIFSGYAFIQENQLSSKQIFKYKLLDLKSAITILFTVAGLILVRKHFVLGLMPRIIYEARKHDKEKTWLLNSNESVWAVKIKNVGLGPAIMLSISFRLKVDGEYMGYQKFIEELRLKGLCLERDFYLSNITLGYTIPSKDEACIFEVVINKTIDLKCLDVKMEFKGLLGEKYSKVVYCIPRLGINRTSSIQLVN